MFVLNFYVKVIYYIFFNIFDSNRGQTKRLYPNITDVEDTVSGFTLNSDGFSTGTSSVGDINVADKTMVTWQWKANGGTTSSNTAGTITSTVQTNSTADFSIITYTGNGTDGANIGHGLSGAWDCVWMKNRGQTDGWQIFHKVQQDGGTNTGVQFQDDGALVTCADSSARPTRNGTTLINLNDCGDLGSLTVSYTHLTLPTNREV